MFEWKCYVSGKTLREAMNNPIDRALGEKMRTIRAARRMTQEDVANALKLDAREVDNLEAGRERLTAAQLVELGALFGISAEEFLYHVEGQDRATSGGRINVFEHLDGEALEFAYLFSKIANPRHRDAVMRLTRSLIDDPVFHQ